MHLEAFDWANPDVDLDAPPDTLDFHYSIEFSVREAGEEASTDYQVIVCSPSMTSEARAQDDLFIVQKTFDLSALEAEAAKRLRDVARSRPSNRGTHSASIIIGNTTTRASRLSDLGER